MKTDLESYRHRHNPQTREWEIYSVTTGEVVERHPYKQAAVVAGRLAALRHAAATAMRESFVAAEPMKRRREGKV